MTFIEKIERHLAYSQINSVIDAFSELKRDCPISQISALSDLKQLNSQIIVLSSKYNDLNQRVNIGTADANTENKEKSSIVKGFTDILNQLPDIYPDLYRYILTRDEEEEWKDAQAANTVAAYEQYFNKYSPNGKYIESTKKLIAELREIERKREDEKKNLAQEARTRREQVYRNEPPIETNRPYPGNATTIPQSKGDNKKFIYIGAGVLLVILLIFLIKPKNNSSTVALNPSEDTTASADNQVVCRDCRVWKFLWLDDGGVQYDALLVFNPGKGYGKMRVKFFDGNRNIIIQEEMNQVSTDQGQYIAGKNPFDTETSQPLTSYIPDNVIMDGADVAVFDIENGQTRSHKATLLDINDVTSEYNVFGFTWNDLDF